MAHVLSWLLTGGGRYWPLSFVLRVEAVLLAVLFALDGPLPVTRMSLVIALLLAAAGLAPALLRPNPASSWAASVSLMLAAIMLVPFEPLALATPTVLAGGALPAALILRLVNTALIGPAILQFSALFLRGRPLPPWLFAACLGLEAALLATALLVAPLARFSILALVGATFVLGWVSLAWLVRERRRAPGALVITVGATITMLPLSVRAGLLALGLPPLPYPPMLLAQLALPICFLAAILRHNLFGIDANRRRAVGYTVASIGLLAGFFLLIALGTAVLARLQPPNRGVAMMLWFLSAASAFVPLRTRAQRQIDARFYPERAAFAPAIAALHTRLLQVADHTAIRHMLTKTLPEQIEATGALLLLDPALPAPQQAEGWATTLHVGDQVMAHFALGPRRSGLAYNAEEQSQLQALAQQAALALAYAEANQELRELNRSLAGQVAEQTARVVDQQRALAVMEERQRLARDLHDSVTQTLFSINLSARAIRPLVNRNPQAATEALIEQEQSAQQALAEMRALLVQLRAPLDALPASATLDFAAMLAQHCAALRLDIDLDTPPVLLLPQTLANELAHIAREALHNVSRHSGASAAQVRLQHESGRISLTIRDSGRGFDPAAVGGGHFGVHGMHERVAALGGTLLLESAPGRGTHIQVVIPSTTDTVTHQGAHA